MFFLVKRKPLKIDTGQCQLILKGQLKFTTNVLKLHFLLTIYN